MDLTLHKNTLRTKIAGVPCEVSTDHLVNLIRGTQIETGLMIPAVRWISPNHRALILERPVHQATIEFTHTVGHEEPKHVSYTLPIPWTVTAMVFGPELSSVEGVRMYVRNRPLTPKGTDVLGVPPYPNFYHSGAACLGGDFHANYQQWRLGLGRQPTLMEAYMAANGALWNSRWNAEVQVWLMPWRIPPQVPAQLRVGPFTGEAPPHMVRHHNENLSHKILNVYTKASVLAMVDWEFPAADGDLDWLVATMHELAHVEQPGVFTNLLTQAALG